jgi:hypothetical protein
LRKRVTAKPIKDKEKRLRKWKGLLVVRLAMMRHLRTHAVMGLASIDKALI